MLLPFVIAEKYISRGVELILVVYAGETTEIMKQLREES
jgi:hypothetical protein